MSDKSCLEIVVDFLPEKMRRIIDENVETDEDIKAVVKGIKGEAVAVTDKGVHIIKEEKEHYLFPYDKINRVRVSRANRVGRFELFVEEQDEYNVKKDPHDSSYYGPDKSKNVVNFPYSKFPMFQVAKRYVRKFTGDYEVKYDFS
ncbi:MAG: hypothetical protein D5R97_02095 [Candidatus Syntrophonatronum acetioxidans]|uniref:Uncharacterized protein n=1 Tax=Candidatus Syntrophonatronum acetioxidans TaxID=1795816 RepID=A0A424YHF0_9FIRM|nr:MAG: hypothetical protein D5R97_02095 [Candidatus Syntrophonatronum acetioxidans]